MITGDTLQLHLTYTLFQFLTSWKLIKILQLLHIKSYSLLCIANSSFYKTKGDNFKVPITTAINTYFKYIYMFGFLKTVLKNWSRALSGRLFLARNSKGDDIKTKRKVSSPFFLPSASLSFFHCRPFSFLFLFFFLPFYIARRRPLGDSLVLHCALLLRTIFASSACAHERACTKRKRFPSNLAR